MEFPLLSIFVFSMIGSDFMKKMHLLVYSILAIMLFANCSNKVDSINGNKQNTDVKATIENKKNLKKYDLSFRKTDFKVNNPYISYGVFTVNFEDKTYNFSDLSGKLISKNNYFGVVAGFSEGYAFVVDKDKKGYYIDNKGKKVIETVNGEKIKIGDIFVKGVAKVFLNSNKEVSIDKSGKICPPVEKKYKGYSVAGNYYTDNKNYGLFDEKNNKALTKLIYKNITRFEGNKALVVDMNDNLLLINVKGDIIVNLSEKFPNIDTEDIDDISKEYFAVNFNDDANSKILDLSGNVIVETEFSSIGKFDDGFAICKKGDKFGCTDKNGNEVIPAKYSNISNIYAENNMHFALVQDGEVWSICTIK